MNEIVIISLSFLNNFLLAGDKFMPEMHLKLPGFTYSAWGPFSKNKERIRKFKETGGRSYIYKNELDKACFQQDMVYGDFKDLTKRTPSDKVLRDKAFNIAKSPKYDGYQRGPASMVYKCFDKNSKGGGAHTQAKPVQTTYANDKIKQNQRSLDLAAHQLAEELHESIIRKFKKRTVYSGFKDNIWSADLADMKLISKFS